MRIPASLLALLAVVAGGAAAAPARDPAACLALFNTYDTAAWLYPDHNFRGDNSFVMPAPLSRPTELLRQNGCLTLSTDIDGMPTLAARLSPHVVTDSGPSIPATAVHVGVVLGIYDEGRATQFFRGLGYRSRGVGASGLGRRLYIGPFTSQGALDEALTIAREAGFISPYAAQHTKF